MKNLSEDEWHRFPGPFGHKAGEEDKDDTFGHKAGGEEVILPRTKV